jgi:hypothetical protein
VDEAGRGAKDGAAILKGTEPDAGRATNALQAARSLTVKFVGPAEVGARDRDRAACRSVGLGSAT